MSNTIHPIRKMRKALYPRGLTVYQSQAREKIIARHVKPLLDALEDAHCIPSQDGPHCGQGGNAEFCPTCSLLSAWRAKL